MADDAAHVPCTGAAAAAATAGANSDAPKLPGTADFLDRVVLGERTLGTIVRITEAGLCVTASRCLVKGGKFIRGASAFGGELELAGSSPSNDILFVKGKAGTAVQPFESPGRIGQTVSLVGYPLTAADQDLGTKEHLATQPSVTRGHVLKFSPSMDLAAADCGSGALPNAPGSAVLTEWGTLAGVCVGAWPREDLGRGYEPGEEEQLELQAPPPTRWDTDADAMWQPASCNSSSQGQDKSSRAAGESATATQDTSNPAQHAAVESTNSHKEQVALFVPVNLIWRLARDHKLLNWVSGLDGAWRQHLATCYKPRGRGGVGICLQ